MFCRLVQKIEGIVRQGRRHAATGGKRGSRTLQPTRLGCPQSHQRVATRRTELSTKKRLFYQLTRPHTRNICQRIVDKRRHDSPTPETFFLLRRLGMRSVRVKVMRVQVN